jgi:hypothetical protein
VSNEVTVEVSVPEPEPEPTPEVAPVVVVVEDEPTPEPTTDVVDINHESRLTALEMQQVQMLSLLEQVAANTAGAQVTADVAVEEAEAAVVIAEEAAEGEQPSPEDDPAPQNEHWFFK